MNDYLIVQFAKSIRKTTSQLTLWDMLRFNKWKSPESSKDILEKKEQIPDKLEDKL